MPHVCPKCEDKSYFGILVAPGWPAPACPNCKTIVEPIDTVRMVRDMAALAAKLGGRVITIPVEPTFLPSFVPTLPPVYV